MQSDAGKHSAQTAKESGGKKEYIFIAFGIDNCPCHLWRFTLSFFWCSSWGTTPSQSERMTTLSVAFRPPPESQLQNPHTRLERIIGDARRSEWYPVLFEVFNVVSVILDYFLVDGVTI